MQLHIHYSQEKEVERVLYTLHKYDWYVSQRYRVFLPDGIDIDSAKEEIHSRIQHLFTPSEYLEKGKEFEKLFAQHRQQFSTALQKIFPEVPNAIGLTITKYGVGGSYGLPNRVLCNIQYGGIESENIFHEIIHLCVEPYIQRYKIDHWEKERIVDLLLHAELFSFLNYTKWQKSYKGAEKSVDPLFPLIFEDVDQFFRTLKGEA